MYTHVYESTLFLHSKIPFTSFKILEEDIKMGADVCDFLIPI